MPAADWRRLSASLPAGYTDAQVYELFYTGQDAGAAAKRRPGFLSMLEDDAYRKVYEHVRGTLRVRFVDVHGLLETSKDEARIMVQVLNHVVAWLNPSPTLVHDRRDNNKPPLWNDLVPALQRCTEERIQSAARRLNSEVNTHTGAEAAAVLLQQEVLGYVRENALAFKSPTTKQYLDSMPASTDEPAYAQRFLDLAWGHVLTIVRQYVGTSFQPTWVTSGDLRGAPLKTSGSLTEAICRVSELIPEIAQNPALRTRSALEALAAAIDKPVLEWVARQCQLALEDGTDSTRALSAATIQQTSVAAIQQTKEAQYKEGAGSLLAKRASVPPVESESSSSERDEAGSTSPVISSVPPEPPATGSSGGSGSGSGLGRALAEGFCQPAQRKRLPSARKLQAGNEDGRMARNDTSKIPPQSSSPFQSRSDQVGSSDRVGGEESKKGKDRRLPAWARGVKATGRG